MTDWRPVNGYEGLYEVSSDGEVRNRHGHTLSPFKLGSRYPYLTVQLYRDGKSKMRHIHQLVAEAFLGPRPAGQGVRHGPGGRFDNRAENLCYGTPGENSADRYRDGTMTLCKLTAEAVINCRERYHHGESIKSLAREYSVNITTMSAAIRGETWKHLPSPQKTAAPTLRGQQAQNAKLTDAAVTQCRREYSPWGRDGGKTLQQLADEHDVDVSTMYSAVKGKAWKHVP